MDLTEGKGGRSSKDRDIEEESSKGVEGGGRHACAACRHQRRKCQPDCVMAPYFPADKMEEFQDAHRIFGVSNITKWLKSLDSPASRNSAAASLKWEASAWKFDPVNGPLGAYNKLKSQLNLHSSSPHLPFTPTTNIASSHYHPHHNFSMPMPTPIIPHNNSHPQSNTNNNNNGFDSSSSSSWVPTSYQIYDQQRQQQRVRPFVSLAGRGTGNRGSAVNQRPLGETNLGSVDPQAFNHFNFYNGTGSPITSSNSMNGNIRPPVLYHQNPSAAQLLMRQGTITNPSPPPPYQFRVPPR